MAQLYDVIGNKDYLKDLKYFVKNIIMNDDHQNRKNYNFFLDSTDLSDYYYRFTILVENNDIISIQGIRHTNKPMKYPQHVCKIADRHYVNKKYRISHLGTRTPYYANYCLKNDIDYLLKTTSCVDTVFLSMEGIRGKKHFERRQIQVLENVGYKFVTDNFFYQTCSNINVKSCWQSCLYNNIRGKENQLDLPKICYEEWNTLEN